MHTENTTLLSGLYYPFSRCINLSSLKQMLLVFEQLVFLDPVDDEGWRAELFRKMEAVDDPRFAKYRNLCDDLPLLFEQNAIARRDPDNCTNIETDTTVAGALSDLQDSSWTRLASSPEKYRLPFRPDADGSATWQIFLPKMPRKFVQTLQGEAQFQPHIIVEGDERASWSLSYAAGSAVAMNAHLAAAEELGLAPITDSALHHDLLIAKLARSSGSSSAEPVSSELTRQLASRIAVSMIASILPDDALQHVTVADILRFREDTKSLRESLIKNLRTQLSLLSRVPELSHLKQAATQIQTDLEKELQIFQAEFTSTRDKLWPSLVKSATTGLASGSLAGVAFTYIGGPGYAICSSILGTALGVLKSALDLRAERNKLANTASPGISYLSSVSDSFAFAKSD